MNSLSSTKVKWNFNDITVCKENHSSISYVDAAEVEFY